MSETLAAGMSVIRVAESSLRDLMKSAVTEGQYAQVAVLAEWAGQLSHIGRNGKATDPVPRVVRAAESTSGSAKTRGRRKARAKLARRGAKYPSFKRSGDNLVRIAWSKTAKVEYHHQAPKGVVLALLRKMQQISHNDTLITMDDILPLSLDEHGEVPAYQSYACLGWLRTIRALEQHGRRGYSVLGGPECESLVEREWAELPLHRH